MSKHPDRAPATGLPATEGLRDSAYDARDRAERHRIMVGFGFSPDMVEAIDARPIEATDWRAIAEAAVRTYDDLRDAVEIMDQKIVVLSERDDGTVSQYGIGDSTWHRVLAVARGFTSEKARVAIDQRLAAADRAERGLPLDVERLAKAIEQRRTGLPFEEPLLVSDLEEAAGIAAEYNRLAASQPTPGTHEIERDALRTTILAAIENIAHGRTGAAVAGLRAARDRYGFRVALVTPPETTA